MQRVWQWLHAGKVICLAVTAGWFVLAAVSAGHANTGPQGKEKDQKKSGVTQQLCPPNGGTCSVNSPCCPNPAQEQTKTKTPDKPAPAPKKQP
jgi:hypothetical protein